MGEQEMKKLWTGLCIGGPMNGTEGQSRYPRGYVYVDMPNGIFWIYDWDSARERFVVRRETPQPIDKGKLRTMTEQHDWDIRTAEEEVSRDNAGTTGTG